MEKIFVIILPLLALLAFSGLARADFYKYVDNDGVVHITNVPTSAKYEWMMRERRVHIPTDKATTSRKDFEEIINSASLRYGVDPTLVKAIVKAESDFDAMAVSRAGARGLMQLMPQTARDMGVRDVHSPQENVEGGIRYLSKLLKMFDWKLHLAIAAYNAGENAVLKYGTIPPYSETQNYVKKVMYYYDGYRSGAR